VPPNGDLEDEALARLNDSHVCLHLQSTLAVTLQARRQILDRVYDEIRRDKVVAAERIGA
jgi:hypothetical protein